MAHAGRRDKCRWTIRWPRSDQRAESPTGYTARICVTFGASIGASFLRTKVWRTVVVRPHKRCYQIAFVARKSGGVGLILVHQPAHHSGDAALRTFVAGDVAIELAGDRRGKFALEMVHDHIDGSACLV